MTCSVSTHPARRRSAGRCRASRKPRRPPSAPAPYPTRLTLASALLECKELCVCDLAWISGRPQNLVSHHMRLLRSSKLARSRRDGKLVLYSLTEHGFTLLGGILRRSFVSKL